MEQVRPTNQVQTTAANAKGRNFYILLAALGLVVLALIFGVLYGYNSLVAKDETAATAWSNLQSQYQRRADLIPNLVNTVKGYAQHESSTLEGVINARAKATQVQVSSSDLTPEKMQELQAAQGELGRALGRLMAVSESYPELKADENFSELQAQLEGTENRINHSRSLYNESVRDYNLSVRRFPSNVIAGLFGFEKRVPFEADDAAQKAPSVNF